jgi:ABC-type nitrate/sulfonate/bicarbonate transport system permease component
MSRATAIRVAIIAAVIVILELVCQLGWVRPGLLTPPTRMVTELVALMQTSSFWQSVWISTHSIVIAFVCAVIVGSVIGLLLHSAPRVRGSVEPLIASYYALPFFVIYPLLIVLLGMNHKPIILIGFLYAVMAMIIGVLNGLDRIPVVLMRTGQTYRMSGPQQAFYISLPAAAPYIFTGGKLAFGYAITGVLGSEFILADSGFGYNIAFAYNNFDDKKMYAHLLFLITVISLVTILIYRAERAVEHRSGTGRISGDRAVDSKLSKVVAAGVIALILLALWQWAHVVVGREALASPAVTLTHFTMLVQTEQLWFHAAETFKALGMALMISCGAGAILGALIGISPMAIKVASPMLVTLYALPKVTLYPLVLLFFGVGLSAKVVFGAMYGMIPIMLIVINAIQSMNQVLLKTARVMRLTKMQSLGTVVIPAMIPELVTGIRISFSITFLGVMIGEMFASSRGLGFMLMNSININDTSTMMAVTVMVAIFAVVINASLLSLEHAVSRD